MTVDNGDVNGISGLMDLAATLDREALFAGLQMAVAAMIDLAYSPESDRRGELGNAVMRIHRALLTGGAAVRPPEQTNRYGRTGKR